MKDVKIPELIDRDKLIEIMSREHTRLAIECSLLDEWFSGWDDCYIIWRDAIKKLPNETENMQEYFYEAFCAAPTSKADELVFKTLRDTTENLNSMRAPLELRPLFSKPKTEVRTLEDVVDEVLYCKNCGAYVCYPTERNARDEYRYCHHCGKLLDWDDISISEDYKKLEEVENERSCNKDI